MSEYDTDFFLWSREQADLLRYLIKLAVSPADRPRAGWRRTIVEQRVQIGRLLRNSPSLLALLDLAEFDGQPEADPASLAFTDDQVLRPWLPD